MKTIAHTLKARFAALIICEKELFFRAQDKSLSLITETLPTVFLSFTTQNKLRPSFINANYI